MTGRMSSAGLLFGEDSGEPLPELFADGGVAGESRKRVFQLAPVVAQLIGRQCVYGVRWLLDVRGFCVHG